MGASVCVSGRLLEVSLRPGGSGRLCSSTSGVSVVTVNLALPLLADLGGDSFSESSSDFCK